MSIFTIIAGVNGVGKSSLTGLLKGERSDLGIIVDVDAISAKCGGNIKGGGIPGPQGILDVAGGSGRERIRGDGGDDDQVDVFRLQSAGLQRALGGLRTHVGSVLVRGGDAAFHDARAFDDPFVGSVHHLFQIRIGQAAFRNIGTRADDLDGQSFKSDFRICGHSFRRMMNRKRPDV